MKIKLKSIWPLVTFIVGGLCGAVSTSILFHVYVLSPYCNSVLTEISVDTQQLYQGKTEDVLKRKVKSLPSLTRSYYDHYYKFMPNDNCRYASLWQVQKYYQISGDTIPVEIESILESLPLRPLTSCEIRKIKDINSTDVNNSKCVPLNSCSKKKNSDELQDAIQKQGVTKVKELLSKGVDLEPAAQDADPKTSFKTRFRTD